MIGLFKFAGLIKPIARTLRAANNVVSSRNDSEWKGISIPEPLNEYITNLESVSDLLFDAAEKIGISRTDLQSEIENLAG